MITIAAMWSAAAPAAFADDRPMARSGKTQVVARLEQREITIADLRGEISRLGLSPVDPGAERAAMQSIVTRALLVDAARERDFHRQPEILRQMARAQEQALSDLFLATASQPSEPTRAEIEDFIADNAELFGNRRIYTFSVLTMKAAAFDEETLTPLFDDSVDFVPLIEWLDANGTSFEVAPAVQPADVFPTLIRKQLAAYGPNDNIVLRTDERAQIMKIVAVSAAPRDQDETYAFARQALLAQAAEKKAKRIVERLQEESKITYYRASAAPPPRSQEE